jgi:serine/threonine protein kinase
MARRQLTDQAQRVQTDVAFALDQAGPMLERLRALADRDRPRDDTLVRLYDLVVGRPGVAYASISFTDGTFRGAYLADHRVEVQESRPGDRGTYVERFRVTAGALESLRRETTDYDPRQRAFYKLAIKTAARAWTEPYTFFASHETGITCTEPVYDTDRTLVAVITVDFDVGELSSYVARAALDQARSLMYTRDGIILAYPAADRLAPTDKLLRHEDLHDAAIEALFAHPETGVFELDTSDGAYLASVEPVGGRRAGVAVPLDWFVATVVPVETLLGPTHALERSSAIASAIALAIAVLLAVVLAWNLIRMRRQVAASRAEARSAEARAKELGSYRLVARLGTGGMGEVWRAEHRLLARSAAIKLIRPETMREPRAVAEVRERFRREAQVLASMRSRHTIEIFDYGVTDDGVFFYVMELLDGLDLEAIVLRHGAQPPARVIRILMQACASLAEAHDAGLFHRDIKPPNLFLCRAADEVDIVKLLDFGIVQTVHETEAPANRDAGAPFDPTGKLTQVGALLGTPGFMAPEQILGMKLDGRADLYALGCVGWWLLAGREVFQREGDNHHALMRKHIYDTVPSLAQAMPNPCLPELEAVIRSCLAKELGDRPRDARSLARALAAIPIPADQTWDAQMAATWWTSYKTPAIEPVRPSEVQVIVPERVPPQHRDTVQDRLSGGDSRTAPWRSRQ